MPGPWDWAKQAAQLFLDLADFEQANLFGSTFSTPMGDSMRMGKSFQPYSGIEAQAAPNLGTVRYWNDFPPELVARHELGHVMDPTGQEAWDQAPAWARFLAEQSYGRVFDYPSLAQFNPQEAPYQEIPANEIGAQLYAMGFGNPMSPGSTAQEGEDFESVGGSGGGGSEEPGMTIGTYPEQGEDGSIWEVFYIIESDEVIGKRQVS